MHPMYDIPSWFENKIKVMIFVSKGMENDPEVYYVVSNHPSTLDCMTDPVLYPFLQDKKVVHIPDCHFIDQSSLEDSYSLWLCYNADCAFPSMYVVPADSFTDAYDKITDDTSICDIPEDCLKDYHPEDINYSDSGKPIETDALQIHELKPYLFLF